MGDLAEFAKIRAGLLGWALWVLCGLSLSACHSSDDWKGKIEVLTQNGNPPRMAGDVFSKGDLLLFNVLMNRSMAAIIANLDTGSAKVLVHPLKAVVPLQTNEAQSRTSFFCPATHIEECLKARSFKPMGEEVVDGHPCTIYEGDVHYSGHPAKQKIWRPKDLKNVLFLKSTTLVDDGRTVEAHLTDVTYEELDANLFAVPAGYKPFNTGMLPPGAVLPGKPTAGH